MRSLPIGILLTIGLRKLPKGNWWWRMLILGGLNIGLFQALLFVAAYRLPGGVAATAGAVQPLLVVFFAWFILNNQPNSIYRNCHRLNSFKTLPWNGLEVWALKTFE